MMLLAAAAWASLPLLGLACTTEHDCSLNGRCVGGACTCYAPWSTANGDTLGCGRLDTLPGPKLGAYGQQPHLASWGGNAILHEGQYHLFVSSMTEGCGLSAWPSNMQVRSAAAFCAATPVRSAGPLLTMTD